MQTIIYYKGVEKFFQSVGFNCETAIQEKQRLFIGSWQGEKVLLKLGRVKNNLERLWYQRNRLFYEFLQRVSTPLAPRLPELYYSGENKLYNVLIFAYLEGEALGRSEPIREYWGKKRDLSVVLEILGDWHSISADFISFIRKGKGRQEYYINVDTDAIADKIRNKWQNKWFAREFWQALTDKERDKLQSFALAFQSKQSLLDRQSCYLCHRDLRPQNFHKTKKRIYLLDFDFIGKGTRVFDFLTFWVFLYKRQDLRKFWWESFMEKVDLTKNEIAILEFEKLYFLLLETNELFKKHGRGVADPNGEIEKWKCRTFEEFRKELCLF